MLQSDSTMERGSRRTQYLAAFCAGLPCLYIGSLIAWASPALPKYQRNETDISVTNAEFSWISSLLNLVAIPGCLLAQYLSDTLGRKKTILISGIPAVLGCVTVVYAKNATWLMIGRAICGVANGIIIVVVGVYLTEISDKEVRGTIGTLQKVILNIGSLLIYSVGPFIAYGTLNLVVLSISIIYLLSCLWIPESPFYLLKEEKFDEARQVMMKLKGLKHEKSLEAEMAVMAAGVKQEMTHKSTFRELLTQKRYRRALIIASGGKMLQQATGNLAIAAYLETIFRESGTTVSPELVSIIYGIVQFFAGLAPVYLADRVGRRMLLLISCVGLAISHTIVGLYFFMKENIVVSEDALTTISLMPLLGIMSFVILYNLGCGTIPMVIQVELFPTNVKSIASCLMVVFGTTQSFLVVKGFQNVKDWLGNATVFWTFAIVGYLGAIFVYYVIPETKGKSFQEVQEEMERTHSGPEAEPLKGQQKG